MRQVSGCSKQISITTIFFNIVRIDHKTFSSWNLLRFENDLYTVRVVKLAGF
jgi:hypothetical protein